MGRMRREFNLKNLQSSHNLLLVVLSSFQVKVTVATYMLDLAFGRLSWTCRMPCGLYSSSTTMVLVLVLAMIRAGLFSQIGVSNLVSRDGSVHEVSVPSLCFLQPPCSEDALDLCLLGISYLQALFTGIL